MSVHFAKERFKQTNDKWIEILGPNSQNLFFSQIGRISWSVFPCNPFHPIVISAGKVKSLSWRGYSTQVGFSLTQNHYTLLERIAKTNTPAYLANSRATKEKCFCEYGPRTNRNNDCLEWKLLKEFDFFIARERKKRKKKHNLNVTQ